MLLLTLSRRDWGHCHNITMSRTVPSSQDQCSNCSLRARSNFTCSLYTVRLLGANCELSPLGDFHIHKNSRNTFLSEKYIFLLFPNSHFIMNALQKMFISNIVIMRKQIPIILVQCQPLLTQSVVCSQRTHNTSHYCAQGSVRKCFRLVFSAKSKNHSDVKVGHCILEHRN